MPAENRMTNLRTPADLVADVRLAHERGCGHGVPISVALKELSAGEKQSDWIWYVFPQIRLGVTTMSKQFSVQTCADIAALLDDSYIRANISQAFVLAAGHISSGASIASIFRHDDRKVRSSAALFAGYLDAKVRPDCAEFHAAASALRAAADHEIGPCDATLKFLQDC
jgi:uncharacterized protein (DUF1810 family)